MSKYEKLQGFNVVVTGGSKGLGKALVDLFASRGATVITCSRNMTDRTDKEGRVLRIDCDLSSQAGAREFAYLALDMTDGIDILVNNASDPGAPGLRDFSETPVEDALMAITVNYLSPIELIRILLPAMSARGEAIVVNVTSDVVSNLEIGWGAYAASKAALEVFSSIISKECHESGVHSILFDPGDMDTDLHRLFLPDDKGLPAPDISATKLLEQLNRKWTDICGSRIEATEND